MTCYFKVLENWLNIFAMQSMLKVLGCEFLHFPSYLCEVVDYMDVT